jgi:phospholipid/cholesterol/gamma-HCH transport system ATP-binding protein
MSTHNEIERTFQPTNFGVISMALKPEGASCSRDERTEEPPVLFVRGLEMSYGSEVLMRDITFTVGRSEVMIIMGGSGSEKSTLMKYLVGLKKVERGDIFCYGRSFSKASEEERKEIQKGVGLKGFEDYYPSEISGGMVKRAGLARAMALDPPLLYLDEPSAGLDPISSRRLDDLILHLRDSFGTTIVVVSHELAQIFAIGDNSIFLDVEVKTITARGNPRELIENSKTDSKVREFLRRGVS